MSKAADACNQKMGQVVETLNATYALQKPLEVYCSSDDIKHVSPDKASILDQICL